MNIIAAIASNGVIGANGGIPWKAPEDMKRFRELTTGGAVIMGRRTWESLGGKPLKDRMNIVVSTKTTVGSGPRMLDPWSTDSWEYAYHWAEHCCGLTTWIIGGARLYEATLPYAKRLELTRVFAEPEGDTFWNPNLDAFDLIAAAVHKPLAVGPTGVAPTIMFETYERRA